MCDVQHVVWDGIRSHLYRVLDASCLGGLFMVNVRLTHRGRLPRRCSRSVVSVVIGWGCWLCRYMHMAGPRSVLVALSTVG